MLSLENCWLAGASLPWLARAISSFSRACASRQSVVPSDCRNRWPSTKKCVCHVLPRFMSDIPLLSSFQSDVLRRFRHVVPCSAHHLRFSSRCIFPLQSVEQYLCAARRAMNFVGHFSQTLAR